MWRFDDIRRDQVTTGEQRRREVTLAQRIAAKEGMR
jgi:hypothetical protein